MFHPMKCSFRDTYVLFCHEKLNLIVDQSMLLRTKVDLDVAESAADFISSTVQVGRCEDTGIQDFPSEVETLASSIELENKGAQCM